MANPGEVNQLIGRAYQSVFIGALENSIKGFQNKFEVEREPEKTSFKARTGKNFSFDFSGIHTREWNTAEVFGECKGYTKGSSLLPEYRSFLAKAYTASADYPRHKNDFFWFVTNVPFACSEGTGIRSFEFIRAALLDPAKPEIEEILGNSHVDEALIWSLVRRVGVFILTDSFLMQTDILYRVREGESLWLILKKIHGGFVPSEFGFVASQVATRNNLRSPDRLVSGRRIKLAWRGILSRGDRITGGF